MLSTQLCATLISVMIANVMTMTTEELQSPMTGSGTTLVNGEPTVYIIKEGLLIIESDIIIGKESALNPRNPVITGGIWANNYVPYIIDPSLDATMQGRIAAAIAHWESNTYVRFGVRNGESDYVRFITSSGCSSYIGRIGGEQPINLANVCSVGNTIHEIGHAIGWHHTHNREDRDTYVTINFANILSGREHNFQKRTVGYQDCGTYDYGSIMHYGRYGFSNNGQETITPTQAGVVIGQRNGLSGNDILCANQRYPNPNPCIDSCAGVANGDYQSCNGCNVYASCCEQMLLDNRPCPYGLVWDDNKKWCDYSSDTCNAGPNPPNPPNPPNCVSSCVGVSNGDYQSCNGCNVYVSCSNGNTYDNRPCAPGHPGANLLWDDNTKSCELVSTTCP